MSLTGDNTAKFWASCPKVLGHRRRSSSSGLFNINITEPILAKYKHLAKLHSDSSALGLNAVNKPSLPRGTLFRSSLPATPLTSPMYTSILHQFTEKAIQDLLDKSSTPKVVKSSSDYELKLSNINAQQTPGQKTRINMFDIPVNDQNIITRGSMISRPKTLDIKSKIVSQLSKINENGRADDETKEAINNQLSKSFYCSIKEEQEENEVEEQPSLNKSENDKSIKTASNDKISDSNVNVESSVVDVPMKNNLTKNMSIETIVLNDSSDIDITAQNLANVTMNDNKSNIIDTKISSNKDSINKTVDQNGLQNDHEAEDLQQNCLFVKNLHYNLNDNELREFFSKFGNVSNARIIFDHHSKVSKCFGFVTFYNLNDDHRILSMPKENFKLKGRSIHLSLAKNKKK